jgi:hypothetical protein
MDFDTPIEPGTVWIESSIHMRWLKHVRGYRVLKVHQVPRAGLFGRVGFRTKWLMAPAAGREPSGNSRLLFRKYR